MLECCFEAGSLGRTASPRPPRWAIDPAFAACAIYSRQVRKGRKGILDVRMWECGNARRCEGVFQHRNESAGVLGETALPGFYGSSDR